MIEGYELIIHADHEAAALVEAMLEELGALAVTLTDAGDHPILEPAPGETPLWPDIAVTGFFGPDADLTAIEQRLTQAGFGRIARREIGEEDWVRAWMDDFQPMRFGRRLWIVPSHCPTPEEAEIIVRLDPGLAFGTGTHPTTALCLRWLDGLDLSGRRVLDFGCGSGILAIAAAALGAREVTGVDIDPQAEEATRRNAEANGVADRVAVVPAAEPGPQAFDVVVANILAGTLVEQAPVISRLCRPGGRLALSGILSSQSELVRAAYENAFDNLSEETLGDWVCMTARRKDSA